MPPRAAAVGRRSTVPLVLLATIRRGSTVPLVLLATVRRSVLSLVVPGGALVVLAATGLAAQQPSGSDPDGDGIPSDRDACPLEAETVNGHSDRDGCPDSLDTLLELARSDIDSFWRGELPKLGAAYRPPADVVVYDATAATACVPAGPGNAMYCALDATVYLHRGFLEDEFRQGDFAAVLIPAHEWGHLVQHILGLMGSPRLSIQSELQADCFGGAFAGYADRVLGRLEDDDWDDALNGLFRAGRADVPWLDPNAHGSAGNRIDAFTYGYRNSAVACTEAGFRKTMGGAFPVFPDEGEPQGSLRGQVPQTVGVYVLQNVEEVPELLAAGATDALVAGYRSPEGVAVQYTLIAYPSEASAAAFLDEVETHYRGAGFEVTDGGSVTAPDGTEAGRYVQLRGDREILAWSNRRLFEGADGPIGDAQAFTDAHFANYPF